MKKIVAVFLLPFLLIGCQSQQEQTEVATEAVLEEAQEVREQVQEAKKEVAMKVGGRKKWNVQSHTSCVIFFFDFRLGICLAHY